MNETTTDQDRFVTLDPRPDEDAQERNADVFARGPVWGLEVTVPALAQRCKANIDPQHGSMHTDRACIEEVLCGHHGAVRTPGDDVILATVRPDADSIGAMAILDLRRDLRASDESPPPWWELVAHRARIIGAADREARGPWPGPQPALDIGTADALLGPAAVPAALAMDADLPLHERVRLVRAWLTGTLAVEREAAELARLREEAQRAVHSLHVEEDEGIAVVIGTHRCAMTLGYRLAPVVVATNPEFRFHGGQPHRKHTVARWNADVPMEWGYMLDMLKATEGGWGGSTSICGSPQGVNSRLTTERVVEIVRKHRRASRLADPTTGAEGRRPIPGRGPADSYRF